MSTRKRTRAKGHTQRNISEQRDTGLTVSESDTTAHNKFAKEVDIMFMNSELIARVKVSDGVTLNMGNYSSFRRDVGIEVDTILPPGNPESGELLTEEQEDHIKRMHDRLGDMVTDKLEEAAADAMEYFEDQA